MREMRERERQVGFVGLVVDWWNGRQGRGVEMFLLASLLVLAVVERDESVSKSERAAWRARLKADDDALGRVISGHSTAGRCLYRALSPADARTAAQPSTTRTRRRCAISRERGARRPFLRATTMMMICGEAARHRCS